MWEGVREVVAGVVEGTISGVAGAWNAARRTRPDVSPEVASVIVRELRDHVNPDFDSAMELLAQDRRITQDERCSPEDMARWVRESREAPLIHRLRYRDSFLVACTEGRVDSMAFLTHYRARRAAFLSYLVTRASSRGADGPCAIATRALVAHMRHRLWRTAPSVRVLLTEVDDPRIALSPVQRNTHLGRLRHFDRIACMEGLGFRVLDHPYLQPRLEEDDAVPERRMLLAVVVRDGPLQADRVDRRAVRRLLEFAYRTVYWDSHVTNPARARPHRAYLDALCTKAIAALPAHMAVLSGREAMRRWR